MTKYTTLPESARSINDDVRIFDERGAATLGELKETLHWLFVQANMIEPVTSQQGVDNLRWLIEKICEIEPGRKRTLRTPEQIAEIIAEGFKRSDRERLMREKIRQHELAQLSRLIDKYPGEALDIQQGND